jgi:hypothetical protein
MKTKKLVYVIILLLFLAPILLAEDYKKEIPVDEAMKYYCITWINPAYIENPDAAGIKTMNEDGTFEWYSNETSKETLWDGTFKIEKSWIDKDGNVWLNMIYYVWGYKKYTLAKISDDGNTLEQIYSYDAYPTEVVPDDPSYFIMYKK